LPGRTPKEAVDGFLGPLKDTLSCIARAKFTLSEGGYNTPGRIHALALNKNEPIKLRGPKFLFKLQMSYEIIPVDETGREPWRVTTHAYNYEVQTSNGQAVVSFHWHPQGKVQDPHIHVGNTQLAADAVLTNKLHIATSRVSLESVIRTCIAELGVDPLRDDWDKVLSLREADFQTHRKWDAAPPPSSG
jgi:hypothetical protein